MESELARMVQQAQEEQAKLVKKLASPAAVRQRQNSWGAFDELGAASALALFERKFASHVDGASEVPLSDGEVVRYLNDRTALLAPAPRSDGNPTLAESTLPLRAETESGAHRPVDLSLRRESGTLEPRNPLVEVSIPERLDAGIEVGNARPLGIRLAGAAGASPARSVGDDGVFYANAGRDRDVFVAPRPTGVEISTQLRSPDAAALERYELDLPEGAQLEKGRAGEIAITRSGQVLGQILPPVATDAQGRNVPVSLSAGGSSFNVETDFRGEAFAFPILVDPVVETYSFGAATFSNTHWPGYVTPGAPSYACPGMDPNVCNWTGQRLMLYTPVGTYPAGSGTQKKWTIPNGTPPQTTNAWIESVSFGNSLWTGHTMAAPFSILMLAIEDTGGSWNPNRAFFGNQPINGASTTRLPATGSSTNTEGERVLFFQWDFTGSASYHNVQATAWAESATINLTDPGPPSMTDELAHTLPAGWSAGGSVHTFGVGASDQGLGVKRQRFLRPKIGSSSIPGFPGYEAASAETSSCTGGKLAPCPQAPIEKFYGYDTGPNNMAEGMNPAYTQATDPLATDYSGDHSATKEQFYIRIDRSQPVLNITGGLSQSGGGAADELHVVATDGDRGDLSPAYYSTARSGVKSLELKIDDSQVQFQEASCTHEWGSCSRTLDYDAGTAGLPDGDHTFRVIAKDQLNNQKSQFWTATIDNDPPEITGVETQDAWHDTDQVSATLTATNAGSGVERIELTLPGGQVLEHQFNCSPACPTEAEHEFTFAAAGLPEGIGTATAEAIGPGNQVGSSEDFDVKIDHSDPELSVSGGLYEGEGELDLHVEATDGDAGNPTTARSGVASAELLIDGVRAQATEGGQNGEAIVTQDCPSGSCSLTEDFAFNDMAHPPGPHDFELVATDGVGRVETKEWSAATTHEPPEITAIDFDHAGGWIGDEPGSVTVSAEGEAGIHHITLNLPGGGEATHAFACTPGCPASVEHELSFDGGDITEGVGAITAIAYGPGENASDPESFEVKGDHSPPAMTVTGTANDPEAAGNELTVSATDGDAGQPDAARSGVKSFDVLVDGRSLDGAEQECTAALGSCPLEEQFSIDPAEVSPGVHEIEVVARDQVDQEHREVWDEELGGTAEPDAPEIEQSDAAPVDETAEFLYTGEDPVQEDLDTEKLDAERTVVLRGAVKDDDSDALPDATVSVVDHPEFGTTQTEEDGRFSMVANGGTQLTLRYEAVGHLPAERQVDAPLQDYVWLDDVALVHLEDDSQEVSLESAPPQVFQADEPVKDGEGSRRQTILIPSDQSAELDMPNGSSPSLDDMTLRVTEFTEGEDGELQMPAELPATSAYTYAFAVTVDEAVEAGAESIEFSKPMALYNENFLDFPVGTPVPVGTYDTDAGAWKSEEDGRVIEILSEAGGLAVLATESEGVAATQQQLDDLGITNEERAQLAATYEPGKQLWRAAIDHFTYIDLNYAPVYAPADATQGPQGAAETDCQSEASGSIIGCERQTLGEEVPLVGSELRLHYQSDRVAGYQPRIKIPISPGSLPSSLKEIRLTASIAGRRFRKTFSTAPNQTYTLKWDGRDTYGRPVPGAQQMTVRLGYVYPGGWAAPGTSGRSFGNANGGSPLATLEGPDRLDVTVWRQYTRTVGHWNAKPLGLGGWSLSEHHSYDPVNRILYEGDGSQRSIETMGFKTVVGSQPTGDLGDGGPATAASMIAPEGIELGPDGSMYIADRFHNRIRRVFPDGHIDTVAGNGQRGFSGDGGSATTAGLDLPADVAVAPDGSFYICDTGSRRVRYVDTDGDIRTVAGNGTLVGEDVEGSLGTSVAMEAPIECELSADGSLYIAYGYLSGGVVRLDPAGYLSHVFTAIQYGQILVSGLALDGEGNLYISARIWANSDGRINRITPDGSVSLFAGEGAPGIGGGGQNPGDGGPAIEAGFNQITGLSIGPDGGLFVAESGGRIRRIDKDRLITTVAGRVTVDGPGGENPPDGTPALQKGFPPNGIEVAPDGNIFVTTAPWFTVLQIGSSMPSYDGNPLRVASEDGSEVYRFSPEGRHLDTVNAFTGAQKYVFGYDSAGRLTSITDGDGNLTSIGHDGAGNPTVIEAPFGQETTLAVSGSGYLDSITNPEDEEIEAGYSGDGLMQSFTTPEGHRSTFDYDGEGRLLRDTDAAGGFKELTRTDSPDSFSVDLETEMGRVTSHKVETSSSASDVPANPEGLKSSGEDELRTITDPSGLSSRLWTAQDRGGSVAQRPDGTVVSQKLTGDPRFNLHSPYAASTSVKTPSGLELNIKRSRQATLSNSSDPFSLTSQTETTEVEGRTYTTSLNNTAGSRALTTTTPEGRGVAASLDGQGRPLALAYPDVTPASYAYDTHGRLDAAAQGPREWDYEYDADGNLAEITDPLERTREFAYDEADRLAVETLPDGRQIALSYDDDGNVASVTPPSRPAHTFDHNAVEHPSAYTPPDIGDGGEPIRYAYNDDHDLTKVTRPDDSEIDLGYDSDGRLQTVTEPGGAQTSLTYHATRGKLETVSAPGGIGLDFDFDGPLPTQESLSGPVSGTASRVYDSSFRITESRVNGAHTIAYGYDQDSLVTSAGSLGLTRDPESGFLTGTTLQETTDERTYNAFGELVAYGASHAQDELYAVEYERDDGGRITDKTETTSAGTKVTEHVYDDSGRLEEVTVDGQIAATYAYDANGNRTSVDRAGEDPVAATYDAQDRIATYGALAFEHTQNGDLASKTNTATQETTSYDYDALGNLDSVELPAGEEIAYLTDGLGRRVGRKLDGQITNGFLYGDEAQGPTAELDDQGNVRSRFVYATSRVVPDYMSRDGNTYRFVRDQLGSPLMVVDAGSGAVAQRLSYDEFGRVLSDSAPGFQPFGFAGGLYDPATGLTRFGARDYDAETGRWTAKDPIGFAGGDPNLYGYVLADPVNSVDPSGLSFRPPGPDLPDLPSPGDAVDAVGDAYSNFTDAAQDALEFWAGESIDPCNSAAEQVLSGVAGSFAALATDENLPVTAGTLATAGGTGVAGAIGREFVKRYPVAAWYIGKHAKKILKAIRKVGDGDPGP